MVRKVLQSNGGDVSKTGEEGEGRPLLRIFPKAKVLKFPVVLIETLLKEVDLHLLTFPFHPKSGTNVHASYPLLFN